MQTASTLKSCDIKDLYLSKPLQKAMQDTPNDPTIKQMAAGRTVMCATLTTAAIGCCYVSSVSSVTLAQPCCALGCYAFLAVPCCTVLDNMNPQTKFDIQNIRFQRRHFARLR